MLFPDTPSNPTEQNLPLTSRRGILGSIGVTGLALIATSTPASAFLFQKKNDVPKVVVARGSTPVAANQTVDLSDLPPDWVHQQGQLIADYERYLGSLKLQRLTAHQVVEAHAKSRGGVWNSLPPKAWWNRMGYTLRVVDRVAVELDMPVKQIVSAYRSPAYNARCPGAKRGSWHQANVAVDVQFPVRASVVTAATRSLRDRGLFKGGVGSYSSFTHIDTRGTNINW